LVVNSSVLHVDKNDFILVYQIEFLNEKEGTRVVSYNIYLFFISIFYISRLEYAIYIGTNIYDGQRERESDGVGVVLLMRNS